MNLIDFWTHQGQPPSRSQDVPAHVRAIRDLWPIIEKTGAKTVLEAGCGERPTTLETMLIEHGVTVTTLDSHAEADIKGDMHYLPEIADKSYDLAVSRHSLEHCIAPYFALDTLARIAKYVLIVIPDDAKRWAYWQGHLSVFPRCVWERMFRLMSLHIVYFGIGDFTSETDYEKNIEWRYLLKREAMELGSYEADGHFVGSYPKLVSEGWQ